MDDAFVWVSKHSCIVSLLRGIRAAHLDDEASNAANYVLERGTIHSFVRCLESWIYIVARLPAYPRVDISLSKVNLSRSHRVTRYCGGLIVRPYCVRSWRMGSS